MGKLKANGVIPGWRSFFRYWMGGVFSHSIPIANVGWVEPNRSNIWIYTRSP